MAVEKLKLSKFAEIYRARFRVDKVTVAETLTRWRVALYFIVDDVVTIANFHRDKLGFPYERCWGEPPGSRDGNHHANTGR